MRRVLQHEANENGYCKSCHNNVGHSHRTDCIVGRQPAYENRQPVQIAVLHDMLYVLDDEG